MIYILSGNDTKKKNAYLKKLYKNGQPIFIPQSDVSKGILFEYAETVSLFGESPIVITEGVIKGGDISLSTDDLLFLNNSKTVFVFLEEKLLATDSKKYKKHSIIEDFNIEAVKQSPKVNVFGIADAFSRRDKIGTWTLYREAVSMGVAPEEISGIIFWKIKTMILNGTKSFDINDLKMMSSELVALYHSAHHGDCDFTVGLEQFILSSLDKQKK